MKGGGGGVSGHASVCGCGACRMPDRCEPPAHGRLTVRKEGADWLGAQPAGCAWRLDWAAAPCTMAH